MLLCVHTRYNLFAHSSCTSVFILIFINPQYTVLHIWSHCTFDSLFYFIICSYFHFYSHLFLYILLCYVSLFCNLFFLHFPLSGPVLTYISLLIIPCMIVYVTNNKEPWTLNLNAGQGYMKEESNIMPCCLKHVYLLVHALGVCEYSVQVTNWVLFRSFFLWFKTVWTYITDQLRSV